MTFNWKKTALIVVNSILAVYLLLAITAFNKPVEANDVCTEVNIHIQDGAVKGFLSTDDVKSLLQKKHVYPLGNRLSIVDVRRIEEVLNQNPFVRSAECYRTQAGCIDIRISQRLPVIRIKADNGEDYYVDEKGTIMPYSRFVSDMVVATGAIRRPFAQKVLTDIGRYLLAHPLWGNQIEQLNVLPDETIEMVPRVGDHIVYLGRPQHLDMKLARLEKFYKYGLPKAGWNKYSYINIEFDNQIICKKRK